MLIYFLRYIGFIYKLNKSQLESSDHVTLVHLYGIQTEFQIEVHEPCPEHKGEQA